ncbi:MFS transporter [Chelatococcus sambhunathii]|uniref:MFS transporter n=1 Tax=Chelatococcus sambhunathii TaxID=363953 RepID=A0ABU1DDB3_9HYPH|nr:MFS transporter [Chelatococcus sambhunathii]MDR4306104.1 MFS transporter [Chelatococcus sambhunathii]
MDRDQLPGARRTILFVNAAHALDHFVLLIYPTAVIVVARDLELDYGALIGLATGAFVAFGLFSLPFGWMADRVGRRRLLATFFLGCGFACCGVATAGGPMAIAGWLFVLGVFSAIYHPIGSSLLVSNAVRLGRTLGWNGVWGNIGAATASGVTALIAAEFGWRAAFVVPGLACVAAGVAYLLLTPGETRPSPPAKSSGGGGEGRTSRTVTLLAIFAVAIVAGGLTFNIATIAAPKAIDERLGLDLPLGLVGSLTTLVFVFGALTQVAVGRLVDRFTLPSIFAGVSLFQPIGLGLAATTTGPLMLLGLALAMAAIYGQVVVNDAMVARYVPAAWRSRAFGIRYFLGFTASGFAAPLIAFLHGQGGFATVFACAAAFGFAIFAAAVATLITSRTRAVPAPAE